MCLHSLHHVQDKGLHIPKCGRKKIYYGMPIRAGSSPHREVVRQQPYPVCSSPPLDRTLEVQNLLHFPLHFLLDGDDHHHLNIFVVQIQ